MTIKIYLEAMSLGAVTVILTTMCWSVSVVISYYFYKWAVNLIKNRTKHLNRLKKHKIFPEVKPAISMVKQKRANGKV